MPKKLLTSVILLWITAQVLAQTDLRNDHAFFKNRAQDYASWLEGNELGRFFSLDQVRVAPGKVSLLLRAHFKGEKAGDSLRAAWSELRRQFYMGSKQELHVAMLNKLAFQLELSADSLEILLRPPGSRYVIRIFGEREGPQRLTVRWEDWGDQEMGNGVIRIPVEEIAEVFRIGGARIGERPGLQMSQVRRAIQKFFRENYVNKGTDWFWKARIDSTNQIYNDFSYTVTHISREVLKSHNFFELHQIDVVVAHGNEGLEISWTFQAKYGGGLIFPPRNDSNDYHDFETSPYKEQFNRYQTALFKRLEAYLKRV